MANLKSKYRKSPPLTASFDFIDILSRQGYGVFYLASALDSSATEKRIIVSQVIDSHSLRTTETAGSLNEGSMTLKLDKDHDILVNAPVIINGKVTINMTSYLYAATDTFTAEYIVKLRKWDGSTETEIGSAKTAEMTTSGEDNFERHTLEIDVTRTIIPKGTYIRVTIEGYTKESADADNLIGYYHDPTTRTSGINDSGDYSGFGSDFKVSIPFDIQL